MKRISFVLLAVAASFMIPRHTNAQFLKRLKNEVKTRAENHVINDAGNVTDKVIDKTEDEAVNGVKGKPAQETNATAAPAAEDAAAATAPTASSTPSTATQPNSMEAFKSYDFVPGDRVIFQSDLQEQKDAELPARLGLLKGNAEIQTYEGEKIIRMDKGGDVVLIPQMDSADYLPEQFTVEFDFLIDGDNPREYNTLYVNFFKPDKADNYIAANQGDYYFSLYEASLCDWGKSISQQQLPEALGQALSAPRTWHHVALYVHKKIGKVYIDQYRVAASNTMPEGVTRMSLGARGHLGYYIKNFRIDAGGSDAYHKIMTEGRLITHGIHFASGKADLLPESMGTINEVYNLLKDHSDLKFEIDGHTDSDGSPDVNMKLSQQRADAVKAQLASMGIDASRLTTKGFGETKPIDGNDSPEGKANNRRVEFVKM